MLHQKKALYKAVLFSMKSVLPTGEIHLRCVKSMRDEIRLRRMTDGFHFTVRRSQTISLKVKPLISPFVERQKISF